MTSARPAGRSRRLLVAVVAAALAGTTAACGISGDSTDTSRDVDLADVVRRAVDQARDRRSPDSGDQAPDAPSGGTGERSPIGTDQRTTFDYAQYQRTLEATFGLLEQYWGQTLPGLGGTYSDPSRYVYYRSDSGEGPRCGRQEAPANNAFYCPAGDFIAWDESGLVIPYYVRGGDFAASFVLAHEFGHAMQARLPRQEDVGVVRELQADCFAGAWSRWVSDQGLLEAGDLDEATLAVFSARDVPGTSWTDPAAHGSGFQRARAFGDGVEAGVQTCYPAPVDRWVVTASS